jgi:hypothetical protein
MATDRRLDERISRWLEAEAPDRLPDRVLQATFERTRKTRQQGGWHVLLGRFHMTRSVIALSGAAFVVVVAAVALTLNYANQPGVGGLAAPSPSPTPSPIVSPQPTLARMPGSGSIQAGTYRMSDGKSSIRVTIPQGWVSIEGTDIRKNRDQPNEVTFELYSADINVYPNACATERRGPRTGPTADDLLAALRAQENSDVSEPAVITIGGHPGMRLEVSVPEGLDVASCTLETLRIWSDADDDYLTAGPPSYVTPVYIVETSSGRIVFRTGQEPEATAADLAELQGILDSIQIGPAP